MADFLVMDDSIIGTSTGPTKLNVGTVISDSIYDIESLRAQGAALLPYVDSAMGPVVRAFKLQRTRQAFRNGQLVSMLGSSGLLAGGFELAPEGDHFDAVQNIHIGTPDSPAELWVGGGGPFNGDRILAWAQDEVGTWIDLSDRNAGDPSVPQDPPWIEFTNLSAGNALYFSGRGNSGPVRVVGLAVENQRAMVLGGGSVVAEYWNGAWTDMATLTTDREGPYRPYAHAFLERAPASENMRLPQSITSDWVLSDPMGRNATEYWCRLRIVSPITTSPGISSMRGILSSTKINEDGYIEHFGQARTVQQFGWDVGLLHPASASPGNQDVFRSQNLDVGRTENLFQNAGLRRVSFVSPVPGHMCTSCPITFAWATISNAGGGNVRWVIRWGRTTDGDAVFRTSGAAPPVGPHEQSVTIVDVAPAAADTQKAYTASLDVRDFIGRRPGAFPDGLWISLERDGGHGDDTHLGDMAVINVSGLHVIWASGAYMDL
jgi:hypothetical protein